MRTYDQWHGQLNATPDALRKDTRRPMEMLGICLLLAGWLAACLIVGWALHGLAGAL